MLGHLPEPLSVFELLRILEGKCEEKPKNEITMSHPKATPQGKSPVASRFLKRVVVRRDTPRNEKCSVMDAKILVAEDNAVMIKVLRHQLLSLGFREENINIAENGLEAVTLFASSFGRFYVALLDCQMPFLSGVGAAKVIRLLEAEGQSAHKLHIFWHSAGSVSEDTGDCDVDGFVPKPFTKDKWLFAFKPMCEFRK